MRISDWSSDVCSSDLCLDIVHRDHADRLDLSARAALDHRRKDLAAELDEAVDADAFHRADAFAPANAAGDLLDEEAADRRSVEIGRASGRDSVGAYV